MVSNCFKADFEITEHSRQSGGSSEPSPQSSTVSHFHQKGIHSSVPQRNYIGKKEEKSLVNINTQQSVSYSTLIKAKVEINNTETFPMPFSTRWERKILQKSEQSNLLSGVLH